jgi:hypothetical protein
MVQQWPLCVSHVLSWVVPNRGARSVSLGAFYYYSKFPGKTFYSFELNLMWNERLYDKTVPSSP